MASSAHLSPGPILRPPFNPANLNVGKSVFGYPTKERQFEALVTVCAAHACPFSDSFAPPLSEADAREAVRGSPYLAA